MANLNLSTITYQSPRRSKPVRDNFTDIQNKINEQDASISALSTASSGAEVVDARDYHTDLKDRLQSASKGQGNIIISGGEVAEQGTPNMTVAVAAGEAIVNGTACKWAGANSGTITAPTTHPRYDVVVINSDNTLSIVEGTEAASPAYPDIAATQRPLAILTLVVSQTTIETADIADWRFKGSYNIGTATWSHTDDVQENVTGSGVTVDGVLLKDSKINGMSIGTITENEFIKGSGTLGKDLITSGGPGSDSDGYFFTDSGTSHIKIKILTGTIGTPLDLGLTDTARVVSFSVLSRIAFASDDQLFPPNTVFGAGDLRYRYQAWLEAGATLQTNTQSEEGSKVAGQWYVATVFYVKDPLNPI